MFLLMILLKSELEAKGCFPTALNFLLQPQTLQAGAAGRGDKGSIPWDQPLEFHCVQLCSHSAIGKLEHTVSNYWHRGEKLLAGSKQSSGDPRNTWSADSHCWCCDISVIPGGWPTGEVDPGSCPLHESAFPWHVYTAWILLPILFQMGRLVKLFHLWRNRVLCG